MKFLRNTLSLLVFWAVLSSPSAAQDAKIIPRGENLAVNPHTAEPGWASRCINFFFDNGRMVKRDGQKLVVRITDQDFTGLWTYIDDDGDKRLIGAAQYQTNNYQSLYASSIYSYNVGSTSLQDYIYLGTTPTAAVYNGIFILANGKNRPYRYNGSDFKPLVEVPPGSFDFAPEKPSANTAQVLKGKYYYGWQAAFPDSVAGDSLFAWHSDSLNLDGPSWNIKADSDWIRCMGFTRTSATYKSTGPDSTIVRICRTRAGGANDDSMFYIATLRYDTGITTEIITFIDSIPDDSLGNVGDTSHPFAGFIDTVSHVSDTVFDTLYKLGQPQWYWTYKHATDTFLGISADDSLYPTVAYRRYAYFWIDTATGAVSAPSPFARIPVTKNDTGVAVIVPAHVRPGYWGLLGRSDEYTDTVKISAYHEDRQAAIPTHTPGYYICADGYELQTIDGSPICVKRWWTLRVGKTFSITDAYHPVCTVKTAPDVYQWGQTIYDSIPIVTLQGRDPIRYSLPIGQCTDIAVLRDRTLMAVENRVYFNGYTDFGSEVGYWPAANYFSVGANDGAYITALHSGDNYVDVFTNYSWYRAKETGTNEFTVFEILSDVGCIATNSVVDIPGGGVAFLAEDGFYMFGSHWASPYKETGGNLNRISDPIWPHLSAMSPTAKSECYGWLTKDKRNLIFSFPTVDTSYVMSLATGDWSQWTFAPRMTTEYDISPYRYFGLIPCSGTVFIDWDSDSLFRFGGTKDDLGDSAVQALWKSLEMYQTGEMGKITEFKTWKQSNNANGLDFDIYNNLDTGIVATKRDSLGYRVRRQDINCPESESFKIEIKSYADSLAVDRIDVKYLPTGPMPVD